MAEMPQRRIVTNGKVFRVEQKNNPRGSWFTALWVDYETRDEAQKKMDDLSRKDTEVWEPVDAL